MSANRNPSLLSRFRGLTLTFALIADVLYTSLRGGAPTFDSESVDLLVECEKRWSRQNHAAAEGISIPLTDSLAFGETLYFTGEESRC